MIAVLLLRWASASFAHPAGDGHVSHDTRFVVRDDVVEVVHEIHYPRGFLDLDRRDVRRRGGDDVQFARARLDEVQSGLALTVDERPAGREQLGATFLTPLPDGTEVLRVVWTVPLDASAKHLLALGTANALDEPSMFRAAAEGEREWQNVENVDETWRHEPSARRAVFRVSARPSPARAIAVLGLLVLILIGGRWLTARRRSTRTHP